MTTSTQTANTPPSKLLPDSTPETSNRPAAARPACAACKHQRRRCSPGCLLAPYFPADKKEEFQNMHRLFGINNVVKLLKKVAERDRDDLIRSVIYEANLRAVYPVGGCYTVIRDLQKQINLYTSELDYVLNEIAFFRARLMPNLNVLDEIQERNIKRICPNLTHQKSNSNYSPRAPE